MLPVFTHSVPLGAEYADSVYTVSIEYAEFIDMSREDVDRLRSALLWSVRRDGSRYRLFRWYTARGNTASW